jgi:hypothetical protein
LRRPHDHCRELRTRRRTSRPALAVSRGQHRDAMTPVTSPSQLLSAGEPRLRHCTTVAPSSPKPPLTLSIRPKSPVARRRGDDPATAIVKPAPTTPASAHLLPKPPPHARQPPTRPPAASFPGLSDAGPQCARIGHHGPASETLYLRGPV